MGLTEGNKNELKRSSSEFVGQCTNLTERLVMFINKMLKAATAAKEQQINYFLRPCISVQGLFPFLSRVSSYCP